MMPLQRDSAILHKPMSAFNTPPFEPIQTSTELSWTCTHKGEIDLLPHVNRHVLVFWPYVHLHTPRGTLMHTYHLQDEFTDSSAERGLLAALAGHPQLYHELCDILIPDLFVSTQDTWQPLVVAMETTQCPRVPTDWLPTPDPHATAQRLVDLHQRRLLAAAQERLAQALFDETTPATDIATLLEEEALRIH